MVVSLDFRRYRSVDRYFVFEAKVQGHQSILIGLIDIVLFKDKFYVCQQFDELSVTDVHASMCVVHVHTVVGLRTTANGTQKVGNQHN